MKQSWIQKTVSYDNTMEHSKLGVYPEIVMASQLAECFLLSPNLSLKQRHRGTLKCQNSVSCSNSASVVVSMFFIL